MLLYLVAILVILAILWFIFFIMESDEPAQKCECLVCKEKALARWEENSDDNDTVASPDNTDSESDVEISD